MIISVVILPLLFSIVGAVQDYVNQGSTSSNSFMTGLCTGSDLPAGYFKSPILIENSECAPYGEFKLTMGSGSVAAGAMASVDTDPTTGAVRRLNYNDATLTFNGSTYQSQEIHFRVNAEHVLFDDAKRHAALEMQIIMTKTSGSAGENAILSFLAKELTTADAANIIYSQSPYSQIFTLSATSWTLNLDTLSDLLAAKEAEEVMLNMFTYNGTRTFGDCVLNTWFIYGSELYIDTTSLNYIRGLADTITGTPNAPSTYYNARKYTGTGGGGGEQQITRLCYTGFFKVHLSDNYGLWFGVSSILLYFVFTLTFGDKPLVDYDFHESVWSIHPFVSIAKYGNEIHTKKTRASLFLSMITIIGLFASVFYRDSSDAKKPSNIIVFAVYAALIDIVITFFVGNMLRGYYLAKYQYHKTRDEAWDQKAQNRIFGFYISVFIIVVVGWAFTVWNMGELHAEIDETSSKYWVASFFVGIGLEVIIYYPILCILARSSNFFRRIGRSIGFMYDNICHETYMNFLKHE